MQNTFQNFLLPELGLISKNGKTLNQWIKLNRFSSAILVDECWHLAAYSNSELYNTFTPDFQRFSFASFETFSLASLEKIHCSSTCWPLLKFYYAAFFAAGVCQGSCRLVSDHAA